jgi:hypothetical protein
MYEENCLVQTVKKIPVDKNLKNSGEPKARATAGDVLSHRHALIDAPSV